MTKATGSKIWLFLTVIAAAAFLFALTARARAQAGSQFKAGDRVEADVNMASSPEYQKWQKATIVEVVMWQGKVSGIHIKTDDGRELTLGERHLRKPSEPEKKPADGNQPAPPDKGAAPPKDEEAGGERGQFKAGDRVEVDSVMANEPKDSRWKKATVKTVDMKNGRYVVTLDDFSEMSILMRPGKVWIRALNDGSRTPDLPACDFYKGYRKVSNTAAPSAELFKGVISEWYRSTNKFYDFGVVFEDFKMGQPFKNRALGNGRKDVDPAPIGATIYPLKAKLIFCEKDLNLTFRSEWVNEFACYKSQFGEWVCKNGAPEQYKRTSFPNR